MGKCNLTLMILVTTFSIIVNAEEFDCNKLIGYSYMLSEQFKIGENKIFHNSYNLSCIALTKQQEVYIPEVHWYPKCGKSVCALRRVTRGNNGKCVLSNEVKYDTHGKIRNGVLINSHSCHGIKIYKKIKRFGGLFTFCYEIDAYSAGQDSSKRVDSVKCEGDDETRKAAIDDGVRDPVPVQKMYFFNNQYENGVKQD